MSEARSTVVYTAGGARLRVRRWRLLVEEGPDEGREYLLSERPVELGRGEDVDWSLEDPGVSRRHARLEPAGEGWRVRDLGSSGGTWLEGVEVEAAPLKPEQQLRLGETLLRVRVKDRELKVPAREAGEFHGLRGESPAMRALFGLVEKVGALELPVLLVGESGSGKEGLARALHACSGVAGGPMEVVDCTLLSRDHLRSELFGHVKGAYTGAEEARAGAFERADGGTVLLDEVGEIPLDLQPLLLRVLEEGEVRPLGGERSVRVRARVIGATHRDLPAMVAAGEFRADLYYRLSALIVDVPPLRERGEDVLLLARDFLPEGARLTPEAEEALRAHTWPGNVRELRNAIRRAAALAGPRAITPEELRLRDLPAAPEAAPEAPPAPAPGGAPTLQEVSDQMLVEAIEANGGNRKAAAQQLGIARSTLYRRLKKLGLD